jgi:RNA polymerase sigma-70 factor (ECF subfamily)
MDQVFPLEIVNLSADARVLELHDVDQLVRAYRSRVFRYALLSLKDRDLAETVTQDCFLKAFNTRSQYRGECSVYTWLIKIASNLICDHTRTRHFQFWKHAGASSVDLSLLENQLVAQQQSPEGNLLAREKLRKVWAVVERLSARQRSIFLLRFVEEMEVAEIAQATGIKAGTVKIHLHRALGKIRAELGETRA